MGDRRFLVGMILVLSLLAGCSGGAEVIGVEQSGGQVGPQEIVGATEVLRFDPALIPLDGEEAEPGQCGASTIVSGTYRCATDGGETLEPCFVVDDRTLICDPDPVSLAFAGLVRLTTGALPQVAPPPPDRAVVFFVELNTGMTCAIRATPEPVIIGGIAAIYDCDEPYTYILDGGDLTFDKSAPAWSAAVYTLDPDTGESSGKAPAGVKRAWLP